MCAVRVRGVLVSFSHSTSTCDDAVVARPEGLWLSRNRRAGAVLGLVAGKTDGNVGMLLRSEKHVAWGFSKETARSGSSTVTSEEGRFLDSSIPLRNLRTEDLGSAPSQRSAAGGAQFGRARSSSQAARTYISMLIKEKGRMKPGMVRWCVVDSEP